MKDNPILFSAPMVRADVPLKISSARHGLTMKRSRRSIAKLRI